jgi:hypothetical protein
MATTFSPGQTILRRYWTGDRITVLNALRVVADDNEGLRLWLPAGTPYWRILTADGRTQHEAPFEIAGEDADLAQVRWTGSNVLIWVPPTPVAYSVWWFWDARTGGFQAGTGIWKLLLCDGLTRLPAASTPRIMRWIYGLKRMVRRPGRTSMNSSSGPVIRSTGLQRKRQQFALEVKN